jgi:HPr kinase/phosphorylase
MEIRGIGLIDVRAMYGASAIRTRKVIDIVVELEDWDPNKEYDRLGDERETQEILQMPLTKYTIPVKPGRNLAAILEVAARSYRLSTMGINALDELRNRLKSRSL